MPMFRKDNSSHKNEVHPKPLEQEDILSPFYFPPPEDQMRQKAVAEMFNTSVQTIISWSDTGKIPTFQLGKIPIYSRKLLIYTARNNRSLLKS